MRKVIAFIIPILLLAACSLPPPPPSPTASAPAPTATPSLPPVEIIPPTAPEDELVQAACFGSTAIQQLFFSPDGRQLILTGPQGIYVHALDGLQGDLQFPAPQSFYHAALSPDGATLSLAADGELRRISTADGALLDTLPLEAAGDARLYYTPDGTLATLVHPNGEPDAALYLDPSRRLDAGPAQAAAVSPDGRWMAAWGPDSPQVFLWRLPEGEALEPLDAPGRPNQAAFSPAGRLLAVGGMDGGLTIWDIESREILHTLPGHRSAVTALAFSPDGRLLISAGEDGQGTVWDVGSAGSVARFESETLPWSNTLAVSPGGRFLAAPVPQGGACLWSLPASPEILAETGGWLVYERDGGLYAAGEQGGPLLQLALEGHPLAGSLAPGSAGWLAVRLGLDGSSQTDGISLALLHLPERAAVHHLALTGPLLDEGLSGQQVLQALSQPDAAAWSPDGSRLALAAAPEGEGAGLYLFDLEHGSLQRLTSEAGYPAGLTWSPDGRWIVYQETAAFTATGERETAALWAVPSQGGEPRRLLPDRQGEPFETSLMGWTTAGELVTLTRGAGDRVQVIDPASGTVNDLFAAGSGTVSSAALAPGADALALTFTDSPEVLLLTLSTGEERRVRVDGMEPGGRLAWLETLGRYSLSSPSGAALLDPRGDSLLYAGENTAPLPSPDGRYLAFASRGGALPAGVRIYETDGDLVAELPGQPGDRLAWSPDSKALYLIKDQSLYRYPLPSGPPELLHQGLAQTGSGLVFVPTGLVE